MSLVVFISYPKQFRKTYVNRQVQISQSTQLNNYLYNKRLIQLLIQTRH